MLILAKAAMALMLGFVCAIICGAILIPFLKKFHIGQSVSDTISERHKLKEGTPTMGGIIFIIPVILHIASRIPTDIMVGFRIWISIKKKVCSGLHPSIMAASSISTGIDFTNPQNINTARPAPNPR